MMLTESHLISKSFPLTVLLPCYNEEENILAVLSPLLDLKKNGSLPENTEILVVNDGSTDQSLTLLKNLGTQIRVISQSPNRGYGAALKLGIQASQGEVVIFYDCDQTHNPQDILKLYQKWEHSRCALVTGDRLQPKNQMPWVRRFGNELYLRLLQVLFWKKGFDATSGMRLVHRKSIEPHLRDLPDGLGFTLGLTLLAIRGKLSSCFVPIHYFERGGKSKLSPWKHGWLFLIQILRSRFLNSP